MWEHPNPILLDIETQSACPLEECGGRLYAEHSSTRIFILVMYVDDCFHVWIPDYIHFNSINIDPDRLWPFQLSPRKKVYLYRGKTLPVHLLEVSKSTPLLAHNAYGFDKFIWERFIGKESTWLDSLPVARASGRAGKLDLLGKQLLGQGKDRASKLLPKLTKANPHANGYVYPICNHGDICAFATYAIADVEILRRLWETFQDSYIETDVIRVHNSINERGIQVDIPLLRTLEKLSHYSVEQASKDIEELTNGYLNSNNLRSVKQVHEWLSKYGVTITDDNGKPCLRKEIVQRYIDSPYLLEENLTAVTEIPPIIIEVLSLRLKALRITDAKVKRALSRVSADGRIRDLHSYHVAGTGRFSSNAVQIHNLPHPHSDIKSRIEGIISTLESASKCNDVSITFNRIKESIPKPKDNSLPATVDDICSALLRPVFMAKNGYILAIVDYSQIEARMAPWMANEKKLLDLFANPTVDPYVDFASRIFGIPTQAISDTQRQVGKVALLGLQYSMGANKFRVFAASSKVDLVSVGITAESVIELYRNTYTKICGWKPDRNESFRTGGIWQDLDKAVKRVVHDKTIEDVARCKFFMNGRDLTCILPSGRHMVYPDARIEDIIPPYVYTLNLPPNPKATVVYTSNRGPKSLYGGLIFENIVQGSARDILATALVKLEDNNYNPVLHVHDEPVCEIPELNSIKTLHEIIRLMVDTPQWASGCPIECEGFLSPRFTKKPFDGYKLYKSKDLHHVA